MSLAPAEWRALARIENSLSRSDPELARMLATFTVPVARRRTWRRECLSRRLLRARRFILVTIAVVAMGVMVISGLLDAAGGDRLCLRSGGRAIAGGQALTCPPVEGARSPPRPPSGPGGTGIRPAGR